MSAATDTRMIGHLLDAGEPYVEAFGTPKPRTTFCFINGSGNYETTIIRRLLQSSQWDAPNVVRDLQKFPSDLTTYAGIDSGTGNDRTPTSWGGGFRLTDARYEPQTPSMVTIDLQYERTKHSIFGMDLPSSITITQTAGVCYVYFMGQLFREFDSGNGTNGIGLDIALREWTNSTGTASSSYAPGRPLPYVVRNGARWFSWRMEADLTVNGVGMETWIVTHGQYATQFGYIPPFGVSRMPAKPYFWWDESVADEIKLMWGDSVLWEWAV